MVVTKGGVTIVKCQENAARKFYSICYLKSKMKSNKIAEIFEKHRRQLLAFIRNRTSNEEAEDVLQDVFLRFVEADRVSPITQVASWLFQTARNKLIDNSRKHKEEPMPEMAEGHESDVMFKKLGDLMTSDDDSPEKEQLRNAVWEELEEALANLPDEQRFLFEQTEFEGRSFKDLSEQTHVSVNTLISRKHYAVKFLRNRLRDVYEDLVMD